METITGYVEHVIYRNEENGYTVFVLSAQDEEITCVGSFSVLGEGENYELSGEYTMHPSYGMQFAVKQYVNKDPEDLFSMEKYLGSGAIKGVGPKIAAAIVREFKEDTFRVMEEEPERLAVIKGISKKSALKIAMQVNEKRQMRDAMLFLQKYNISLSLGVKIYATYGEELYSVIKYNPYKMAEDISGVGFKVADEIARAAGIMANSDYRIRAALLHALYEASESGHTYLPKEELIRRTVDLIGVETENVEPLLADLAMDKKVYIKRSDEGEACVYEQGVYYKELNIAARLFALDVYDEVDEREFERDMDRITLETGIDLAPEQRAAVHEAAGRGLFILTGGPGTGKTTTINAIIRYFRLRGMDIMLAAPTGRAAKRMSELTGFEAKTIHRLLEINANPEEGRSFFEKNENEPLETDVVIVDEMSMVDVYLMNSLLLALVPGTRLILVGDTNQLQSVGPGNVLGDIIDSGCFKSVCLKEIFRQAKESDIIVNAHRVNEGLSVRCDNKSRDFFFLKRDDANVIINVVIQLVRDKLPGYVDADLTEIQVLSPMKKGLLGVERLNRILQEYLNPPSKEKKEREVGPQKLFRVGDKVMQTKNDYQTEWKVMTKYGIPVQTGMGVFNGDLGRVVEIDEFSDTITVEFDEKRRVIYSIESCKDLELAYATTIHKSQGSEYPAVVIPLLSGPSMLFNRNLLYTALTRARKCVAIVGSENTFNNMIQNGSKHERYTGLKHRILELREC